ncbi:MAG: hypothetical protein N2327_01180 [Caldimicrobium sp.]|nr:hypothetical protein [Caldimicrobium sp.]MCX7873033.1 hypothetical protein [Caldimicrobium sp.]MDW8094848.1 hypothetical protein [Caldimicrobium sp.]
MGLIVLVPTEIEAQFLQGLPLELYVIGIGPVEAALSAYEIFLQKRPSLVFLTGFAGAYPQTDLEIGDVIVATCEKFVDFGRKYETHLVSFPEHLPSTDYCPLTHVFTEKLIYLLEVKGFNPQGGPLATVCAATYDRKRAHFIAEKFQVLGENMEGFAVGRAAKRAKVFLLEVRIVSNLLSEPEKDWDLQKAGQRLREVWECLAKEWK